MGFISEAVKGEDAAHHLVDAYVHDRWAWAPGEARQAGMHTFDGVVLTQDPKRRQDVIREMRSYVRRARSLLPGVSGGAELDLRLLDLDANRMLVSYMGSRERLTGFDIRELFDVSTYINRNSAPVPERTRALVRHIVEASRAVDPLLARAEASSHELIESMEETIDGYRRYFERDVTSFLRGSDPSSVSSVGLALGSLGRISTWLKDHHGKRQHPMGGDALMSLLRRTEGITTSPAELKALADDQLREHTQTLLAALKRLGPNAKKELDRLTDGTLPEADVLRTAAAQVQEARAFLERTGVVPMLDHGTIIIAPAEAYRPWVTAYVSQPGPVETDDRTFYRVAFPEPGWSERDRRLYLPFEEDLMMTTVHEMFPGHRLQGLHQRESSHLIRRVTQSSTFSEGWAHYAEQLVVESGLRDREPRLMAAFALKAMLRACRLEAVIAFHVDGLSVAEVEKLFRDRSMVDPRTAIQQAKRGLTEPGYLSYVSGKTDILAMRDEFLSRRLGGLREFHAWLLARSAVPPAVLATMLPTV